MLVPMVATVLNTVLWTLAALAVAGAACIAYGVFVERLWFRTRRYGLPILPPDAGERLSVLHLSDLHFLRHDRKKASYLAALPTPDLTVVTGDMLGEPDAVESVVVALRPIRGRLASYFVLGSNDLYAPRPLNYFRYFLPKNRRRRLGIRGRPDELVANLVADGWVYLRNSKATFARDGTRFEVLGLDDAHVERHDLRVAPREDRSSVGLAVSHSPDPAPELAALGYDLILAGHTHGGQVRLPLVGALVTNSSIPRNLCMGLSRMGPSLLHVSPGLGTSKYAKFRFLCRPEATFLELVPRHGKSSG
jgi:hypothetical protein